MTDEEPEEPAETREGRAISRRRFVESAALLSGAAAFPPLLRTRGTTAALPGGDAGAARRAQAFLAEIGHQPPFSFVYGGHASAALLGRWPLTQVQTALDATRTAHTLTWREPGGGLVVRCEAIAYHDFPTVEWTVYFQNAGQRAARVEQGHAAVERHRAIRGQDCAQAGGRRDCRRAKREGRGRAHHRALRN